MNGITLKTPKVVIIGAGIGGLTTGALLAKAGYAVTVLEAQPYAGGSAGTFYRQGYRFDAGATVAGGFHATGPHALIGKLLDINWPVRQHDPAWVVHLPDRQISLTQDNADVVAKFPESAAFWQEQSALADLGWQLSYAGMPWPPTDVAEVAQLVQTSLAHFPADLKFLPFAFSTVADWLRKRGLADNQAFRRFMDAQLLISAQTTSDKVNALWGATALDLARQGVFHVEGGLGSLAQTLIDKIRSLGGEVLFRQQVRQIQVENGRVTGVHARQGKRTARTDFYPADFVVGNLTPWSLDDLLGEASPDSLKREVARLKPGWGAFVLHVGIQAADLPADWPDHHQVIAEMDGPLGETRSLFLSMSPEWDASRAPAGQRAVTITTHTQVQPWWDLLDQSHAAYVARKEAYTERMLEYIERVLPGFNQRITLTLPGTPVTYNYFTGRHQGMVGGFPITSLFKVRGPRTGLPNLRLVGDSIFPGQSTAGVSLGALRVARDVLRHLPQPTPRPIALRETTTHE